MSAQRINELGSDIRRLHHEIMDLTVDEAVSGVKNSEADKLSLQFTTKLLALINLALDMEDTTEKLFSLLEKSGAKTTVK